MLQLRARGPETAVLPASWMQKGRNSYRCECMGTFETDEQPPLINQQSSRTHSLPQLFCAQNEPKRSISLPEARNFLRRTRSQCQAKSSQRTIYLKIAERALEHICTPECLWKPLCTVRNSNENIVQRLAPRILQTRKRF